MPLLRGHPARQQRWCWDTLAKTLALINKLAPPAVTGLTTGLLWSGLDILLNLEQAPSSDHGRGNTTRAGL